MPITSTSGASYHVWALPNLCAPEPQFSIQMTTIENEMSEGHRTRALLGANSGVRTFELTLPTISIYGTSYVDPYGNTVTRQAYLRNLFRYNQTTGIPFAYQHPDTLDYYLVDFENTELEMTRIVKNVDIFSTTVTLKQRRIEGETIFDLEDWAIRAAGTNYLFNESSHSSPNWYDLVTGLLYLDTPAGTVTFAANPQNGHNTVRFSGGYLSGVTTGIDGSLSEIIAVLKVRETTFSGNNGLFSNHTTADVIKGTSGGTKWQNPSLTGFKYYLNGTEYAVTDMQAPMDTWGVCHFKAAKTAAMSFSAGLRIGALASGSGTLAIDLGELYASSTPKSKAQTETIVEHCAIKWGIEI